MAGLEIPIDGWTIRQRQMGGWVDGQMDRWMARWTDTHMSIHLASPELTSYQVSSSWYLVSGIWYEVSGWLESPPFNWISPEVSKNIWYMVVCCNKSNQDNLCTWRAFLIMVFNMLIMMSDVINIPLDITWGFQKYTIYGILCKTNYQEYPYTWRTSLIILMVIRMIAVISIH